MTQHDRLVCSPAPATANIEAVTAEHADPLNRPPWVEVPPDRLMGPGHNAGDLLRADEWLVIEEREGFLRIEAPLPDHLMNPRGQLFGGFTPTYVDLLSIFTVRAGPGRLDPENPRGWVTTINMRIDYFEPVIGPTFEMTGTVEHERGKTRLVSMKMFDAGKLAVHALTTLRVLDEPV